MGRVAQDAGHLGSHEAALGNAAARPILEQWNRFSSACRAISSGRTTPGSGKTVLHIEGSDGLDTGSVTQIDANTMRVAIADESYDYSIAAIDEIHFRGHAADDTFSADDNVPTNMWVLGGEGSDNLTAGGGR